MEQEWAAAALLKICSFRFGVETIIKPNWKGPMMKNLIVATLVGQTIAVSLSTSASAFRCLARSSNGVYTWGYGIFFSRAAHFAVRHVALQGGLIVMSPTVARALRTISFTTAVTVSWAIAAFALSSVPERKSSVTAQQ